MTLLLGNTASSSSGINPLDVSNNVAWFDAQDASSITYSGSYVTQWNDKSGQNMHLTAPGANNTFWPIYSSTAIGGKAGLQIGNSSNSSARFLQRTGGQLGLFGSSTALSLFAVLRTADILPPSIINGATLNWDIFATQWFVPYGATVGTATGRFHWSMAEGASLNETLYVNSGTKTNASTTTTINTSYYTSARIGSSGVVVKQNGASVGTIAGNQSLTPANSDTAFWIGDARSTGLSFEGHIGEFIAYSRYLSDIETELVENYLKQKWGI